MVSLFRAAALYALSPPPRRCVKRSSANFPCASSALRAAATLPLCPCRSRSRLSAACAPRARSPAPRAAWSRPCDAMAKSASSTLAASPVFVAWKSLMPWKNLSTVPLPARPRPRRSSSTPGWYTASISWSTSSAAGSGLPLPPAPVAARSSASSKAVQAPTDRAAVSPAATQCVSTALASCSRFPSARQRTQKPASSPRSLASSPKLVRSVKSSPRMHLPVSSTRWPCASAAPSPSLATMPTSPSATSRTMGRSATPSRP
mmetsp:Transcript_13224/g.39338  ORF Transcript_13224/g.39338 Transcript_13224/m.39338 type:complete len:261 (+) Transcript_13224:1905-2687(+)